PLVRAVPRLQAETRDLPGRGRPARPAPRGDDDGRRALLRPPGGARLRMADGGRASATRGPRQGGGRPAVGAHGRPRGERRRGTGRAAGGALRCTARPEPWTSRARCVSGSVRCASTPSWATITSGLNRSISGGTTASKAGRYTAVSV